MVETDTHNINEEKDFKLLGYNTFFQTKNNPSEKTRIVCLIESKKVGSQEIKLRKDLMSDKFPSIWIEIERNHERNILVCGYYREWSMDGKKTTTLS